VSTALAVGSIGWGLIGVGAASHLRHPGQLADLLRVHTRHADPASRTLIVVETALTVLVAVAVLGGFSTLLRITALGGAALGVGFTVWVLRLSDSDLPCACSWSTAPTSAWSVARAAAVILIGLLAIAGDPGVALSAAALVAGAAMGVAAFLLPDALAWPDESVRLRELARSEVPT